MEEEREREKEEAEASLQLLLLENQLLKEKVLAIEEEREVDAAEGGINEDKGQGVGDVTTVALSGLQQELSSQITESALALETLKITMKTEYDALMVAALNTARQQHRVDMKEYRHRIADRCRTLITKQRTHFALEREETVMLVRRECSDIIQDAHNMFKRNRDNRRQDEDDVPLGNYSQQQLVIYPEMLSQEVTFELVRRVTQQKHEQEQQKKTTLASERENL